MTCLRNEQQIGLDHVEVGEHDVEGRHEDAAQGLTPQVRPDEAVQVAGNRLVFRVRRRRHDVLPVDQLVPLPVVGKLEEVVVGEPDVGGWWPHGVAPGHEGIVPARARCMPSVTDHAIRPSSGQDSSSVAVPAQ